MADWFESRFREPVAVEPVDPAFTARVRAMVVEEWQADAGPTPSRPIDPDEHEGDLIMLETEELPAGHEPQSPGGRAHGRRLLVAAVAAVIAVVGGLLLVAGGDDDEDQPPATTPTTAPARDVMTMPSSADLPPGTYFIDPDGEEATPLRVTFEVTDPDWDPFIGAVKAGGDGYASVFITTVPNLVTEGCLDHTSAAPRVGATVDDLATAMSQLAPFEVTAPPTDVTAFGFSGKHLGLRVPSDMRVDPDAENFHDFADCVDGELHSWISTNNDGSFYGYETPGQTEEFWILDVLGARVVIVKGATPETPAQDLAERDAIFDSIAIEP